MKNRMKKRTLERSKQLLLMPSYLVATLWCVFTIFLFAWILAASFSTTREIFSNKILTSGLHWENYTKALFANNVLLNLCNSLIYSCGSVFISVMICAPASYMLARFSFRGNGLIQKMIVIGLGIPSVMIIMPMFAIVNRLNMSGSRWTLVLLYIGMSVPFVTFYLMTFFKNISVSYEEAAAIDGCGPMRTFWQIVFPMAQPGIVTVVIFQFIGRWNEYFMANIFANKPDLRPVGVGLYSMITSMQTTGDWAGVFASVVLVFVPTLLLFIVLSRRIMSGVTVGGIKG